MPIHNFDFYAWHREQTDAIARKANLDEISKISKKWSDKFDKQCPAIIYKPLIRPEPKLASRLAKFFGVKLINK